MKKTIFLVAALFVMMATAIAQDWTFVNSFTTSTGRHHGNQRDKLCARHDIQQHIFHQDGFGRHGSDEEIRENLNMKINQLLILL